MSLFECSFFMIIINDHSKCPFLVTPGKTTGYYKYPSSTRFLDVKLAILEVLIIEINLPNVFPGVF